MTKNIQVRLTPQEMSDKRLLVEDLSLKILDNEMEIADIEEMLEKKIPERRLRLKLNQQRNQLELLNKNKKIIEGQLRSGSEERVNG